MRRALLLAGIVPFVSAFLGGVLAVNLATPSSATAQADQPREVRATRFVIVADDGTVLGRLGPTGGPQGRGDGQLVLYDSDGTRRIEMVGRGVMNVYEDDGRTIALRAGRTYDPSAAGRPPLDGVELGPDGEIGRIATAP